MTTETIWIVIADGAMARFFCRARPGLRLEELTDLAVTAAEARKLHRQATAVHDGTNHGDHRYHERHDGHDDDEQHFLAHIAGRINLAMTANAFGRLVICAPPRALGVLRNHISEVARQRIVMELDKDIVRDKMHDIDERLKARKV